MKRKLSVGLLSVALLSGLVVGGISWNKSSATDVPPLVQEVQHQGEVLDNHEARITNTENDVKDLQSNTQTPPSNTRVVVKEVVTPAPTEPISTPPPPPAPQEPTYTVECRKTGEGFDIVSGTKWDNYTAYRVAHYNDGSTQEAGSGSAYGMCDHNGNLL